MLLNTLCERRRCRNAHEAFYVNSNNSLSFRFWLDPRFCLSWFELILLFISLFLVKMSVISAYAVFLKYLNLRQKFRS